MVYFFWWIKSQVFVINSISKDKFYWWNTFIAKHYRLPVKMKTKETLHQSVTTSRTESATSITNSWPLLCLLMRSTKELVRDLSAKILWTLITLIPKINHEFNINFILKSNLNFIFCINVKQCGKLVTN